jgi:Glyoxalase-like domain
VEELGDRLGLRLSEGGRHLGFGTRNYLADLGRRRYLEVVGPDAEQPDPDGPRLFGVDTLERPRLVTWAGRVDDLERVAREAAAAGHDVGGIRSMRRDSADGHPIAWLMTPPLAVPECHGLVPFLVQWTAPAHPADRAAPGAHLVALSGSTPDVAGVRRRLTAVGEDIPLTESDHWGLRAVLETPRGQVVLD